MWKDELIWQTQCGILRAIPNLQWEAGRYLLHGHPAGASFWEEVCTRKMFNKHGVARVVVDQCRYGFVATGEGYTGPARKSTGYMTNSPCIAVMMSKRRLNIKHHKADENVILASGRPKAARVHPFAVCTTICAGMRQQMVVDAKRQCLLTQIGRDFDVSGGDLMKVAKEVQSQCRTVEEDDSEVFEQVWATCQAFG